MLVRERIGLFLAPGPVFQWRSSSYRNNEYEDNGDTHIYESAGSGWAAGLDIGIGFEWFFKNRLSLGARYGIAGLYGENDTAQTRAFTQVNPPESFLDKESVHYRTLSIQSESAIVSLTAYF